MTHHGTMVLAVGPCFETEKHFETARLTLSTEGIELVCAADQHSASLWLCEADPAVVLIDLSMRAGSPLAVADFCNYRRPQARVILRGAGELMVDGSLFSHVGNAAAIISDQVPCGDLLALIAFHAAHRLVAA